MFSVTIYPNVDQAFVVSLVVILDEIHSDDESDEEDWWPEVSTNNGPLRLYCSILILQIR